MQLARIDLKQDKDIMLAYLVRAAMKVGNDVGGGNSVAIDSFLRRALNILKGVEVTEEVAAFLQSVLKDLSCLWSVRFDTVLRPLSRTVLLMSPLCYSVPLLSISPKPPTAFWHPCTYLFFSRCLSLFRTTGAFLRPPCFSHLAGTLRSAWPMSQKVPRTR